MRLTKCPKLFCSVPHPELSSSILYFTAEAPARLTYMHLRGSVTRQFARCGDRVIANNLPNTQHNPDFRRG
jgi:hypothetical protein